MMNLAKLSRRFSALMLALVMLMTGFVVPAYAQGDWDMLNIRLMWTDANGNTQEAYAAPVSWSQDQSYWVQVTADAPLSALMMNISHPNHAYVFDPADGSTLMNVVDASSLDGTSMVTINAYENDAWADSFNLYVSTSISMPEEPRQEPARATVHVVYKDIFENYLGENYVELVEGDDANNTIYAPSIDGYSISGADSVFVTVTADGASPSTVEFYYAKNLAQIPVTVQYKDQNGNLLGENTVTLTEGDDANNTVYAAEIPGYTLTSEGSVFVSVTADGASPNPVEFYYAKNLAQVPVTVQYKDQNGNLLGENTVTLTEGDDANNTVYATEIPGYTLTSEGSVFVSVTADGASPNPVEFWYQKNLAQVPVTVQYKDQNGNLLGENTVTLTEGDDANNTVYAAEIPGYTLTSEGSVFVSVTADGASPNPVEFYYAKNLAQVPVTVQYKDQNGNLLGENTVTLTEGDDANNTVYATEIPGYTLTGEGSVFVSVTADGASPNPVEFWYQKNLVQIPVTVQYKDQNGNLLGENTVTLTEGDDANNTVYATEIPGYTLTSEGSVFVSVTTDGASPNPVEFYYAKNLAQVPVMVQYKDQNGNLLGENTVTLTEGDDANNTVYATEIPGYTLTSEGSVFVSVTADGASPNPVEFYYAKNLVQVPVTVQYKDQNGNLLGENTVTLTEGDDANNTVYATEIPGYTLTSEGSVFVSVTADGASPNPVEFWYQKNLAQVPVTVQYKDIFENAITEETVVLTEGDDTNNTIYAKQFDGYSISGAESVFVTVTAEGANPNPVVFYYAKNLATADVVVTHQSDDGVIYEQGTVTMTEGGDNTVYAKEYEGYTLSPESAAAVTVQVSEQGADPAAVTFYYNKIMPKQADVLVRHVSTDNEALAEDAFVTCYEGQENIIQAKEFEGYTLQGEAAVSVTVNSDGMASHSEVVFLYEKIEVPTEAPAPEPPVVEPATADVVVTHQSDDGVIYEQGTVTMTEGGDNTVYAKEYEGYTLSPESAAAVTVQVTEQGADPAAVTFYYNKILPKQADVLVRHVSTDNEALAEDAFVTCYEGQENIIQAKEFEGYTLQGEAAVYVSVNNDGTASHSEVVFRYEKIEVPTEAPETEPPVVEPATADVVVTHQSDDGLIYEQGTVTMTEGGDNTVYAKEYEGYTLSPESAAAVTVQVTEQGADPAAVTFYYNKILPKQADVLVRHVSTDNEALAEDAFVTCYEGQENIIQAKEFEGYTLQGEAAVYVSVNNDGTASHSEVVFRYEKIEVPTEAPAPEPPVVEPATADVVVTYQSDDGLIYEQGTVTMTEGGDNTVYAKEYEGYTLSPESASAVTVQVTEQGAAPAAVTFYYNKILPKQADVLVRHASTDNEALAEDVFVTCYEGQENIIQAKEFEGYTLQGEAAVYVTVNNDGTASHSEVVFLYEKIEVPTEAPAPEQDIILNVYFRNDAGEDVASPIFGKVKNNKTYDVLANPADLKEGYVLVSAEKVSVKVENGVAVPGEVVFLYKLEEVATPTTEPTETPAPVVETPIPQGEMINRFGTVVKAKTALREGPGTNHKDKTRLAKGTVVYMLREELNEKGEAWVRVLVDGEIYYIRTDCIEVMTQANSDEWMANEMSTPVPPFTAGQLDHPGQPTEEPTATPTAEPTATPTAEPTATPTAEPTATPTAAPTEVPAIYTGYALTTTNVAIRSQVNGGDETILRLADMKELVMITGQEFANGSTWSLVTTLDGGSGYIPDANLRHINNEEAQYYIDLWNAAHATAIPTEAPTPTPTVAPTDVPAQYAGYALTTNTVALRTEISAADETILRTLEKNELVMVTGQSYANGESWSLSTTLDNVSGYIPDGSLRRINNEEAAYYLDLWAKEHPTATPTMAPVTPEPAKISGYAYTVGDDVYFRHQATSMASIIDVLSKDVVVYVRDQDYQSGEAWHVVQYDGQWGYIRADMLRMMTVQEENAYLDSLTTPEPTPEATIAPPSPNSLSSYGYVDDSSVNFRKEPNTSSSRIRQLKQYAFCLVLGTTEIDGVTWYRVSYGGQEGYVHGKYFKQMTIAELEEFLDSDEYLEGIQNNTNAGSNTNQDFTTGGGIVSAEDQTVDQWTNPNSGVHVSYEPFDPFATVAPVETPVPTETVTIPVVPTTTLEPIPTMDVTYPTGNDERGGSGILGWVIAVVLIAVIGGGAYAYVTYTNNKRKAAQRAAARRAQAAAQQRQNEARPYARSAQVNQPRTGTYPNQAAQRPMSGTAQPVRRPQQPESFARPVEGEQPRQADYTANYRNPNTAETARPVGRRSAYRAQQTQQNGYTASYRKVEENGDFKPEKDNGDFE